MYRLIPSLHELLLTPGFAALLETESRDSTICAARAVLARLKQEIGEGHHTQASLESELAFVARHGCRSNRPGCALQFAAGHQCHRGGSAYKPGASSLERLCTGAHSRHRGRLLKPRTRSRIGRAQPAGCPCGGTSAAGFDGPGYRNHLHCPRSSSTTVRRPRSWP